jgi:hypothetical protein
MTKTRRAFRTAVASWLRVVAYASAVSAIAMFFAARSVYASLEQRTLSAGASLEHLQDFIARPTRVVLNGQQMIVSSVTSPLPVSEVLDRFAADCDTKSDGLAKTIAALPDETRNKLPPPVVKHFGVLRAMVSDDEGSSACLAQSGAGGIGAFLGHAKTLLATGDASGFGRLQYVFARKSKKGSHVVLVWSTGPFRPLEMFPDEGDAPGSDGPDGVRPPAAVRLLSASTDDAPYSVGVYDSAKSGDEVLAHYDDAMRAHDWVAAPIYAGAGDSSATAGPSRAYTKRGAAAALYTGDQGPRTVVVLVEMGTRGDATAAVGGEP